MSFRIVKVKTSEEIDQVLRLRHRVFAEEEGLLEVNEDRRIFDRYDAYPSTNMYAAMVDGEMVGSVRVTLDSQVGVPADKYFAYRDHLPKESIFGHAGMFCVSEDHRGSKIGMGLMLMAISLSHTSGITHLAAPANPRLARLFQRVGFETVGEEFIEAHSGARMMPLLLDMKNLNDYFVNFIQKNDLIDIAGDYERCFYRAGEQVVKSGEAASEAFVVIDGEAEVKLSESGAVLTRLTQGSVFGELALITGEPRSADVFATANFQLMALPKEAFTKVFLHDPQKALRLLQSMAVRNMDLTDRLS
ncbi:MAG: GNAT family N-acetyltransferase [Verrucomicrobia bacterium]|nr:GNAT family N-acetyltransferase [Verrucomicrobiota bacterium]